MSNKTIPACLRDRDHFRPRREQAHRANQRIEWMSREQIVYMPDHRFAEAKRCDRRYQTVANTVGVNQIRLDADKLFAEFPDDLRKRFEVSYKVIQARGKSRI